MKNEDILGKKGKCADCGDDGKYVYEPYELEIHDEKYLICLCEHCQQSRWENV